MIKRGRGKGAGKWRNCRWRSPEAVGSDVVEMRNSVTNAADADRVLKRWATILNDHLAAVANASGG